MLLTMKDLLSNQFEAALCTLHICIDKCPNAQWNGPIGKYPFCQVAFHTLFFTDYYLGRDAESFREQPIHLDNPDFFGDYEQLQDREPVCRYEKDPIHTYLDHCRTKAVEIIASETTDTMQAHSGFSRRDFSRAELYVYSLRHIQHHTAQLILRLRLETDVDIPWVGSGWSEV